jgi:Fic family protein
MKSADYTCIWQAGDWPAWRHDLAELADPLNEDQVTLLNRLLDGFEGKLTSSKWAAIAKCSPDTALRDVNKLLARGVLRKSDAGGRSTSYELNDLHEGGRPGRSI